MSTTATLWAGIHLHDVYPTDALGVLAVVCNFEGGEGGGDVFRFAGNHPDTSQV